MDHPVTAAASMTGAGMVDVDTATYKAEFLAHHYKARLRPASHYSMGWLPASASSNGLTSHSRVKVIGTATSAIISEWIADSRSPLVSSIRVRRCIR